MPGQKNLPCGETNTGEKVAQAQGRHVQCLENAVYDGTPSGGCVVVGFGKRAPHGFRSLWLVPHHGSLDRVKY